MISLTVLVLKLFLIELVGLLLELLQLVLYLWVFRDWFVVSICLLALHAGEASYVSSSSISAFRAAVVRAVWSSKMPLAHTPAVLNLLDGPVGVDPALHVVWVRFRMMRRYLAYCPEEVPRIFRMLDLISWRAPGRCPVHLLLISAAELGFAWDGDERGWLRPSLPLLRTMTGPIQHFFSSILDAWRYRVFAKLSERKGFLGAEYADFKGSLQLLILFPPEGKR